MRFPIFRVIVPLLACCLIGATHTGPAYDAQPRYALDAFANEIAKEYQLEFLNTGLGTLANAKHGIWALNLISRQEMTLDQGRKLARAIAHKLLDKVFTDPLFAQYCQETTSSHRGPELKEEYVAFRLSFWDQNTNRPHHPYLAQIRLADGNLYYHYANLETEALDEPIIETLYIPGKE